MLSNRNNNDFYSTNELSSSYNNKRIDVEADTPIVVTTALPYANGEIHLGHISSTYLPADIFTRFLRISKKKVFHVCASDDFGTPILIKAEQEKKTPKEFVGPGTNAILKILMRLGYLSINFIRQALMKTKNLYKMFSIN